MSTNPVPPIRIETFTGARERLRALFELAEDSPAELESYLPLGQVLVAVTAGGEIVGHLQLVDTDRQGRCELTKMAVAEAHQGSGIGRALVGSAVELLGARACTALVVATAAADIGNLRFYQRLGFRMCSIERDAFTTATGYPPGVLIDGIPLRDRVWFDLPIAGITPRAARPTR